MSRTFRDDLEQRLEDPEFAKAFGAAQAKSSLALTLAKAREKVGLTQKGLADKLGVSQAYVAKLEGGEANPTFGRIGSLLAMVKLGLTTDTTMLSFHVDNTARTDEWAWDSPPDSHLGARTFTILDSEGTPSRPVPVGR